MSPCPVRIFQFAAAEMVLKAVAGRVLNADKLVFARSAMAASLVAGQRYTHAALDFLNMVNRDQRAAGNQLHEFLQSVLPPDEVDGPEPSPPEFDWQKRADLQ